MTGFYLTLALTALSIFLFFRQDRLDRKAAQRREMESDLHVLEEMRRFLLAKGVDVTRYESAISEIENRLKAFS